MQKADDTMEFKVLKSRTGPIMGPVAFMCANLRFTEKISRS